jgi:sulfur carrier protein
MLTIILNGEPREIAAGSTLGDVLVAAGYAERRIAVEINREIVPKSTHGERVVHDGDRIEIVHALGGG